MDINVESLQSTVFQNCKAFFENLGLSKWESKQNLKQLGWILNARVMQIL